MLVQTVALNCFTVQKSMTITHHGLPSMIQWLPTVCPSTKNPRLLWRYHVLSVAMVLAMSFLEMVPRLARVVSEYSVPLWSLYQSRFKGVHMTKKRNISYKQLDCVQKWTNMYRYKQMSTDDQVNEFNSILPSIRWVRTAISHDFTIWKEDKTSILSKE